jgi:hypothetical protein
MIVTISNVTDFEQFLRISRTRESRREEKRREHGCKGAHVFRDPDDAQRVWCFSTGRKRTTRGSSPTRRFPQSRGSSHSGSRRRRLRPSHNTKPDAACPEGTSDTQLR